MVVRNKPNWKGMNIVEINSIFKRVYSELVHAKMLMNRISFRIDLMRITPYRVPKCVARGTLKKFLKEYRSDVTSTMDIEFV